MLRARSSNLMLVLSSRGTNHPTNPRSSRLAIPLSVFINFVRISVKLLITVFTLLLASKIFNSSKSIFTF